MLTLEDAGLGVVGAETGHARPARVPRDAARRARRVRPPRRRRRVRRATQESLLVTFAASAATAVATAKTVERERLRDSLKAAESERRRWARELHDETLQGLAGLQVLLLVRRAGRRPSDRRRGGRARRRADPGADRGPAHADHRAAPGGARPARPRSPRSRACSRAWARSRASTSPRSSTSAPQRLRSGARDDDLPVRPGGADQRRQARPRRARARPADARARHGRDRDRRRRPRLRSAQQRGEGFGLVGMRERAGARRR